MPGNYEKTVYIGPARPFGLPLMPNAILAGTPDRIFPQIREHFERHPNFRKLFVPVAALASGRAAIKTPGTGLSIIAREIGEASAAFRKQ